METAVCRIEIFALAVRTQREGRHAGVVAVVGQRLDQRVARAALGAVDERVAVTPVLRVLQLMAAVVAHEVIRGHEDTRVGIGRTGRDQEVGIVSRFDALDAGNDRT